MHLLLISVFGLAIWNNSFAFAPAPPPIPVGCSPTGPWKTVDEISSPGSIWGSHANAAAANSSATFVVGTVAIGTGESSMEGWTVRRSTDNGETWSTIEFIVGTPARWLSGNATGVAADPVTGAIYVVGSLSHSRGFHWFVRKSTDNGNTWRTADDIYIDSLEPDLPWHPAAVSVDGRGTIYVVGRIGAGRTDEDTWITRRSTDEGNTWQTVDAFNATQGARALTVATSTTGHVIVGGSTGYDHRKWLVRFSATGAEGTFRNVDSFDLGGKIGDALGSSIRSDGVMVVTGWTTSSFTTGYWITRRSRTSMPESWTTSDSYATSSSVRFAQGHAATFLRGGSLMVTGSLTTNRGPHIATRRGNMATNTHVFSDRYLFSTVTNDHAMGTGITQTPRGDVVVSGRLIDNSHFPRNYWIIRKQTCKPFGGGT